MQGGPFVREGRKNEKTPERLIVKRERGFEARRVRGEQERALQINLTSERKFPRGWPPKSRSLFENDNPPLHTFSGYQRCLNLNGETAFP